MDSQLNSAAEASADSTGNFPVVPTAGGELPGASRDTKSSRMTTSPDRESLTADGVSSEFPVNTANSSPTAGETFLSSVVLLLGMTIAQKLIGFIRTIVVCRLLSPEEMGLWSMVQTTIATVSPILLLSIPACFGRYFEYYRGRHQLQAFLRQATALCAMLLATGVLLLILFREPVAQLTLGSRALSWMIVYASVALIPFAVFCFLTETLTALRYSRLTTFGHFINGVTLAVVSIGLLFTVQKTAQVMLLAFGSAHLIALLWLLPRLGPVVSSVPNDRQRLSFAATWKGLVPIILLFWFNDFMTNMFNLSDRFMLVNLIPGTTEEVMRQIGHYESGHIIPVLFAAVTILIAKTLMPYLAQAWEKGDRVAVGLQTNLSLKLVNALTILAGLCFLPLSGFVFNTIFQGKYDGGSTVLPYVVYFYVGSGFTALIMNYFWCAHRAPWAVLALVLGVAINVSINAMLVPDMGIVGAAIGTVFGISCQVLVLWLMAIGFGLQVDRGTILIALSSGLLLLDPVWAPLWCLLVMGVLLLPGTLNQDDRQILHQAWQSGLSRLRRSRG